MQLTVVGCAGSWPSPRSACSSYLVRHDGFTLLMDAGSGSMGPLQDTVGLLDVDAVYLSHLHGDHWLDLVPYTYALRYHPDGPCGPVPLYAPPGTLERMAAVLTGDTAAVDLLAKVWRLHEVTGAPFEVGPFRASVAPTAHPVPTHALRLAVDGHSLTYSADTGPCTALAELAAGSDLLLCEATFGEVDPVPPDLHLRASQAGEHAARAGVGRLLITHQVGWNQPERAVAAAAATYAGPVQAARPGQVVDL